VQQSACQHLRDTCQYLTLSNTRLSFGCAFTFANSLPKATTARDWAKLVRTTMILLSRETMTREAAPRLS
jgi:hypothetical protein